MCDKKNRFLPRSAVPGSSSCYLRQAIPFPVRDWESKEVATVRVMTQYLSDQMYNLIRGKGLTYGVSMSSSVTEGRMTLKFSRSSQLNDAYDVFTKIMKEYSGPDAPWDETLLDSARGAQVNNKSSCEERAQIFQSVSFSPPRFILGPSEKRPWRICRVCPSSPSFAERGIPTITGGSSRSSQRSHWM